MTQCVCYNEATKENKTEKENKMNGTMKRENFESFGIQNEIVSANCKLSGFSMAAVAGGTFCQQGQRQICIQRRIDLVALTGEEFLAAMQEEIIQILYLFFL